MERQKNEKKEPPIPYEDLLKGAVPCPEAEELLHQAPEDMRRVIVVLDDDPTGIQTVHDVCVYTRWDRKTITDAFREDHRMFFLLTNSRGLTADESREQHRTIARNICAAAGETGRDYILISRGDSTLRGHWPMETEILRETLEKGSEKRFDGEIVIPFFPEGGRFTWKDIHYVCQGNDLIPAGQTEFAKDKSFGYHSSNLRNWVEEKTEGQFPAEAVCSISREELRRGDVKSVVDKLSSVSGFGKIIVNCTAYEDLQVFAAAFWQALKQGHEYLFRSAAALPKVLGGVSDQPLLTREALIDPGNNSGGIILIGSHVNKTTRQLEELKKTEKKITYITFDQHRVLEEGGLEEEADRVLALAEKEISAGRTVTVFTRRERLDLNTEDPARQLQVSVRISDALTGIIGRMQVRPSFIVAKGGITSSDVGTKALRVTKAQVKGQIRPGIPVWQTGPESKFPGLPYVIFPGNVGSDDDLRRIVEELIKD